MKKLIIKEKYMNNLKLLTLLLPTLFIQAQQLDESFLESLPEDIQSDLEERANQQTDDAKEKYRASFL